MLKVPGSEQVMIRVRIAEMQRNIAKQFGIDLASAAVIAGVPLAASSTPAFGLVGRALNDLSGGQAGQVCNPQSTTLNPLNALQGGGICNIGEVRVEGKAGRLAARRRGDVARGYALRANDRSGKQTGELAAGPHEAHFSVTPVPAAAPGYRRREAGPILDKISN